MLRGRLISTNAKGCLISASLAAAAAGLPGGAVQAVANPAVSLPIENPKRAASTPKDASPDASGLAPKSAPIPPRLPHAIRQEAQKSFDAEELLKPLLEFKLGGADRAHLRNAVSASYKHRFDDARSAIGKIENDYAAKVARWYYYRSTGLGAPGEDIEAFRVANPEWPNQTTLRENAERSLFVNKADAETVKTFFAISVPQTGGGKAAIAAMHLANGEKEKARVQISEAWRGYRLTDDIEKAVLERFSELLSEADHKARIDRLLLQDRSNRIASVERVAKLLPEAERKKVEARILVVKRSSAADKMLAAIPAAAAESDIGLHLSRIRWLRRNDKEEKAWSLLTETPHEPSLLHDLDEWWVERRVNCRSALNSGKPELAYAFARDHGPLTGESYREAEFMAGWIALRFLGQTEDALKHFLALRTAVRDGKDVSQAEYWLGRTSAAMGDAEEAERHFGEAAKYPHTYYGQLARQASSRQAQDLPVETAPAPTPEDVRTFLARDAVMAIAVVRAAGYETLAPLFFHQLARTLTSAGEAVLLAELARAIDQPYASVRLGLIAFNRGLPTAEYAFPVGLLPDYKEINGSVEPAFLHALSRQESEFNPKARSPVGARGLMQLMPNTARAVARQFKVGYYPARLTSDPAYNLMLGVAHLSDLIDSYDGSYILTLVAYNAGGGRVTDWTRQFGDPRDPRNDPIDWVERIPFTETREYVQKILTTVQIYRSRIQGPSKALRLVQDLNRDTQLMADGEIGAASASTASPAN